MLRLTHTGLFLSCLFFLQTACTQNEPDFVVAASAPATIQPTATSEQSLLRRVIEHEGMEREYFVFLPEAAAAGKSLPVVVALHGYTSTATGFQAYHGTSRHAEEHGYIIVYPQGSHFLAQASAGKPRRITSWNDLAANLGESESRPHCTADRTQYPCPPECGDCGRCGWVSCYDDLGFLEKMLEAIAAEFQTDTRRYYLLGVSNGGMMALRVGCELSQRFAAVAAIIGQLAPGHACAPGTDLPLLHLVGGLDNSVRADGKPGGEGFIYSTAAETAAIWANGMECGTGPHPWQHPLAEKAGLQCTAYSDCRQPGHEVVSCMDPQGVHVWPGQRVAGVPATCVTPEQAGSMPGQQACPDGSGEYQHWGMDLTWELMRRYQQPE
jgi:polyhydroxybutyrate depolymerase